MELELQQYVTEDLKADPVAWPILEKMSEKDIPSVLKSYAYTMHKQGSMIPVPKPEEADTWRKEHLPKLHKAGVVSPPVELPGAPEKYEVKRPDTIPENLWSKDIEAKLRTLAHEEGLSQKTINRLLELNAEQFTGLNGAVTADSEATVARLKERAEKEGYSYDELIEYGGKWLASKLTEEDIARYEAKGIANDPEILWLIAMAGKDSGEDVSQLGTQTTDAGTSPELQEAQRIMGDPQHPDHQKYIQGDPAITAKVNAAFEKFYKGAKEF